MNISARVARKIRKYNPEGGLAETAFSFLNYLIPDYPLVKEHAERVALLSEIVAIIMKKDAKAAFFAGLLHDVGKAEITKYLFDGRQITKEEYAVVREHAVKGYKTLKKKHLFSAYCAGSHHALNSDGYGLKLKDFPKDWKLQTMKKVLEIAMIVAVCDDIDASLKRSTWINGNKRKENSVERRKRLKKIFSDDIMVVEIALREAKKIIR